MGSIASYLDTREGSDWRCRRTWSAIDYLTRRILSALFLAAVMAGSTTAAPPVAQSGYQLMKWADLLPADWNSQAILRKFDLNSIQDLDDKDPRARKFIARMRVELDKAPANPALDGRKVRLHGFVVLLEGTPDAIYEFLLVPWQGACIHTPPPAANQLVHVISKKPLHGVDLNYPVYVFGDLTVQGSKTGFGHAGYTMSLDREEIYPWQTYKRADW